MTQLDGCVRSTVLECALGTGLLHCGHFAWTLMLRFYFRNPGIFFYLRSSCYSEYVGQNAFFALIKNKTVNVGKACFQMHEVVVARLK